VSRSSSDTVYVAQPLLLAVFELTLLLPVLVPKCPRSFCLAILSTHPLAASPNPSLNNTNLQPHWKVSEWCLLEVPLGIRKLLISRKLVRRATIHTEPLQFVSHTRFHIICRSLGFTFFPPCQSGFMHEKIIIYSGRIECR